METAQALALAKEKELDLVEISPKANPPVCKIMDWGKFQYLQAKKEKEARKKQKKVDMKGVRFRLATSENDLRFKLNQTKRFLEKGHKVRVEILLRGREKAFAKDAQESLRNFIDKIDFPIKIEQAIQRQFNGFNVIIAPEQR